MKELIGKELRMTLRSLVFYLFVVVSCFFYFTQYATSETWSELGPPSSAAPQNIGSAEHPLYGWRAPANVEELAGRMRQEMGWNLQSGTVQKIRIGFLVDKRLSEKEKQAFAAAVSRLEEIIREADKYTMEDVYQVSAKLNRQLGGNTQYRSGLESYEMNLTTPEEGLAAQKLNLAAYEKKVSAGELLPGAARYFCDYLALSAGVFPVFLSAFLLLRDRSSRMSELIYSRSVSRRAYVGSKFIALGAILSVVYLLLAVLGAWQTVSVLELEGQLGEALVAFLGYTAWWLLPTVWTSVAFGMFGSMLFRRGIVPIALQLIWWFVSVLPLMGSYGLFKLLIRFNSPNDYALYRDWMDEIALNRSFYLVLAVLLAAGAAWLWERDRSRADAGAVVRRPRRAKKTSARAEAL
ncbi:ABC transporter permease ['Paenibacillus yunnanensis' Narsing Rao et al. 2020]|uniref:ABC transporter permease n=1 Tax=Paenibacillus tengchongensis TaxID=2608684 RepID=UPI00124CAC6B|nr:ABC transporter permease [Paenibacillus tengchongensis]